VRSYLSWVRDDIFPFLTPMGCNALDKYIRMYCSEHGVSWYPIPLGCHLRFHSIWGDHRRKVPLVAKCRVCGLSCHATESCQDRETYRETPDAIAPTPAPQLAITAGTAPQSQWCRAFQTKKGCRNWKKCRHVHFCGVCKQGPHHKKGCVRP
jgi:hypothetical protein